MPECNVSENKANCTCTYSSCSKKGLCCECLQYHWGMGQLPGCLFPPDVEKTYDRSIAKFVATYQERGPWW